MSCETVQMYLQWAVLGATKCATQALRNLWPRT